MKTLGSHITESFEPEVINEASNPLVKSIDSLFKRIGLKQLKLKVPDTITEPVIIGSLLMDPTDAGMLQPCFKDMKMTATVVCFSNTLNAFRLILEYKWTHPTGGTNGLTVIYNTMDAGITWKDENMRAV